MENATLHLPNAISVYSFADCLFPIAGDSQTEGDIRYQIRFLVLSFYILVPFTLLQENLLEATYHHLLSLSSDHGYHNGPGQQATGQS